MHVSTEILPLYIHVSTEIQLCVLFIYHSAEMWVYADFLAPYHSFRLNIPELEIHYLLHHNFEKKTPWISMLCQRLAFIEQNWTNNQFDRQSPMAPSAYTQE